MSRGRNNNGNGPKHSSVTVPLDEELAAALDRTMIAFGLENRQQTARMALAAWVSAVMEDSTVQLMCQQAVEQVRKNEFEALAEFYDRRRKEYGVR